MKWNKDRFTGTGKVFRFTLYQIFHNKAYITSMVVVALMMLLSVPFSCLVSGGSVSLTSTADLETVYVGNSSDVALFAEEFSGRDSYFENTAFVPLPDPEAFEEGSWRDGADMTEAVLLIQGDKREGYSIDGYFVSEEISYTQQQRLLELAESCFEAARYDQADIDPAQLGVLMQSFEVDSRDLASYENASAVSWEVQYGIQMLYSILVMMFGVYTVSYIIQALAEEKSSKLVEFMLVSVRPEALILGKIFACMVYVLALFGVMGVSLGISYLATSRIMDVSSFTNILANSGMNINLSMMGPMLVLVMLVSLAIGYASFALLAGLFGSACNSMQDIQKATTVPMLIIMSGYMVAIIASAAKSQSVSVILSLIPVVSLYYAPVAYVVGNISFGILALSWLIQLGILALLALFCGRVYGALILYRGGKIGIKEMIAMARRAE